MRRVSFGADQVSVFRDHTSVTVTETVLITAMNSTALLTSVSMNSGGKHVHSSSSVHHTDAVLSLPSCSRVAIDFIMHNHMAFN